MKTCSKCKTGKAKTDFCKDKKRSDGLNLWCKGCCAEYYNNNRKAIRATAKIYRNKMKDVVKEKRKVYFAEHKEEKAAYDVEYRKKNADKIKTYKRIWEANRRNSPIYKIKRSLRRRIHHVIVDGYRSKSSTELLGCTVEYFKTYLESKFLPGMTWDNYGKGGWHIDHIKPCARFDLTKESEQLACFNYKNCQPLWEADNLKKGDSYSTN